MIPFEYHYREIAKLAGSAPICDNGNPRDAEMTSWEIKCTECDYYLEDFRRYGRFYAYLLPDQTTLTIPFVVAWCNGCQEITHAEEMPSLSEIQLRLKAPLATWERAELAILEKWRPHRRSLPKCLRCGSVDFATIDFELLMKRGGKRLPHPGCKGDLCFRTNGGYTLGSVQTQYLFSFEGDYLERQIETDFSIDTSH